MPIIAGIRSRSILRAAAAATAGPLLFVQLTIETMVELKRSELPCEKETTAAAAKGLKVESKESSNDITEARHVGLGPDAPEILIALARG